MKLPVNKVALKNALESVCFKCGSTRIVSSVTICDPVQNPDLESSGWVCKQCYDDMFPLACKGNVMFGSEGFLDDNFTVYDEMEIVQKVKEFNQQFEDKGCRARLLPDDDFYCRVEVTVDDDRPQLAAATREAEHLKELCRHKIPFSKRRADEAA